MSKNMIKQNAITRYKNKLVLYGAFTQSEILNYIQVNCLDEDVGNLEVIMQDWRQAGSDFQQIVQSEQGISDTITVNEINENLHEKLQAISNDTLFKSTFSHLPIEFKMVEIDKLIACQRHVDLDYIDSLKAQFHINGSEEKLIEICLAPTKDLPIPAGRYVAQNGYAFSSPSVDFRFLGGYCKPVGEDDIKANFAGGVPVATIVLLVGYGGSAVNVLASDKRMVLNNGFHRVFALRALGVRYVPAVVQKITNPELEFPPAISGLPKAYLLNSPRPALMKDFFDQRLVRKFSVKETLRSVRVAWQADQSDVPL